MQTDRILLRPWQESDAEALYKYASDSIVGERAGWSPHKSVEESLEIIRTVFNTPTTWAIVLKETNEAIGAMGYMPDCPLNLPARKGEPLVGYWVGKPYWNQGICTEALQLMLEYIRKETNYISLISSHFIDNPASGRVMEKCGFAPTGDTAIDKNLHSGEKREMRVLRLEIVPCTLRSFIYEDAATILTWCKDKRAFRLWSADRYKDYPVTPDEMLHLYKSSKTFPLTMVEGEKIVGHIMLRYPSADKDIIRFGFVIIDDTLRGKGYGRKLLKLAINYARNILHAKRFRLGVFCDNLPALECYKSVGFTVIGNDSYMIDGEEWQGYEMVLNL